jgi:hypothetical protein
MKNLKKKIVAGVCLFLLPTGIFANSKCVNAIREWAKTSNGVRIVQSSNFNTREGYKSERKHVLEKDIFGNKIEVAEDYTMFITRDEKGTCISLDLGNDGILDRLTLFNGNPSEEHLRLSKTEILNFSANNDFNTEISLNKTYKGTEGLNSYNTRSVYDLESELVVYFKEDKLVKLDNHKGYLAQKGYELLLNDYCNTSSN